MTSAAPGAISPLSLVVDSLADRLYVGAATNLEYRIEPVADCADRENFDCGEESVNTFLRERAKAWEGRSNRTIVATADSSKILGYLSLSIATQEREGLPKALRRNRPEFVPCGLIGQLGVSVEARGERIGEALMVAAIERFELVHAAVGIAFVMLELLHDELETYYNNLGFVRLADSRRMILRLPALGL